MSSAKFYDEFITYQVKSGINDRIYSLYKRLLKDGLTTDMNILEIGCGIGVMTYLMSRKVKNGKIEALDLSPKSIEYAQSNLKQSNIEFTAANILDSKEFLPRNGPFDKITLFDVIEHIPLDDHPELFQKISGWMDDDSSLLINIPNPRSIIYDQEHNPDALQEVDQAIFLDQLTSNLSKASLEVEQFETYSIWMKNDYNFIVVKKCKDFEEHLLRDQQTIKEKIILRLKRDFRRISNRYPR